jgi:tetratricopeptide (TPR) repeat protein
MLDKPDVIRFPFVSRLANAPVAFVTYLEKTFWPHDLAILYPFSEQIPLCQVFGAAILIIIASAVVIVMVKRLPYFFVGWLWYAITIAPVIGIIQVSLTTPYAIADRYHYLPSIGIAIMLAWGIPSVTKNKETRKKILLPAGIAVLVILAVFTWQQCGYWKSTAALFSHALHVTKNNNIAHNNLAAVLLKEGKIEEAIDHCNQAIRITPDYADAYYNKGIAYNNLGQYQRAIEDYSEAIRLKPDYTDAFINRGFAYSMTGQYQLAIEDFNKLIRLQPDDFLAYKNRGAAYLSQGNNERGCRDAQMACALGHCELLEGAKGRGHCL